MNEGQDHVPSVESTLKALARLAEARQSRAAAFVHVHGQLIVACLEAGYSSAQIFRGLDELGFHPPMSERQFRRYARTLRRQLPSESAIRPGDSQAGAPVPVGPHSARPQTPNVETERAGAQPAPGSERPVIVKPTTFEWDPTADHDDIA